MSDPALASCPHIYPIWLCTYTNICGYGDDQGTFGPKLTLAKSLVIIEVFGFGDYAIGARDFASLHQRNRSVSEQSRIVAWPMFGVPPGNRNHLPQSHPLPSIRQCKRLLILRNRRYSHPSEPSGMHNAVCGRFPSTCARRRPAREPALSSHTASGRPSSPGVRLNAQLASGTLRVRRS